MPVLLNGVCVAQFVPPGKPVIAYRGLSLHILQVGEGQICGEKYAAAGFYGKWGTPIREVLFCFEEP